jgi:rRNA biogenesis protein RRP5
MTDLGDVYTPTPCDALPPGTILSAVVVGTSAGGHLDLTLRPSRGAHPRDASDGDGDGDGLQQPELKALSDVTPGAVLHGYVKSATPKGVFVTLGRGLDARVKLSNLADAFVPSPETAFPPGSRVTGRVLAVETATHRIELSLKESDVTGGAPMGLGDLTVGQVVRGTVKRVETFGVFVTLAGGGVTGMVHISMFADGPRIKDLQQRIAPGKKVVCKVMTADTDTGRLSLGMKASLFEEGELQEGDAELNAGTGGDGEKDEPLLDTEAVEDEMEEAPKQLQPPPLPQLACSPLQRCWPASWAPVTTRSWPSSGQPQRLVSHRHWRAARTTTTRMRWRQTQLLWPLPRKRRGARRRKRGRRRCECGSVPWLPATLPLTARLTSSACWWAAPTAPTCG